MKCLILAGGFATRLYPLTMNKAKALLEFKGIPIITYIVNKIPKNIDILVTTNKKFEVDFIRWQQTLDRLVEICVEESLDDEHKKGAVGAIDFWIKTRNIREDLLVIAADNYFEFDMTRLIAGFNGNNPLIAVRDVGEKQKACEIGKACQVGLVTLENNKVIIFDEKPLVPTSSIVATGIYVLPSRTFPLLSLYSSESKRDNMGSFITYLLQHGEEIQAHLFGENWMDIGDEVKRGKITI